jgi:8-oxo-dGTP pyrophosphatase MutT (NUDIX family)
MSWALHVTVATIVEQDDRYLLVHEHSEENLVYNQPAGHLEPNETLAQAAIRETMEETGWLVEPTAILGCTLFTSPYNQVTYYRTTFIAKAISHDPKLALDDGIIEAVWLSYEEILEKKAEMRSPVVLQDIEKYRSGQRISLDAICSYSLESSD